MAIFECDIPPRTIEETGLSESFLIGLTAKVINEIGTMTPADIAGIIKLPKLVCRQVVDLMVKQNLLESQGLETQDIKSDIRYSLTDAGRRWAAEAMLASAYIGPAPVTFESFCLQVKRQSIANEEVHRSELDRALSHLVIPPELVPQLGPAANSGRSALLYGEPGNGKTSIAEALGRCFQDTIFLPYAMMVGNQIIRFYDETLHEPAILPEDAPRHDQRWVPCKRPVVVAGGELTLDKLDLSFEEKSRFYEAPMHLKALGGVFILDDFGRQVSPPQEFLNRWIVPLEKNVDYMSLHTGKTFAIPFDQLVVFSSNMMPEELGDGAALRRIYFKIQVPSPTREEYLRIFSEACDRTGIQYRPDVVEPFFRQHYENEGIVTSGAHPGFLLQHVKAICRYMDRPIELTTDVMEIAWKNVAKSKRRGA